MGFEFAKRQAGRQSRWRDDGKHHLVFIYDSTKLPTVFDFYPQLFVNIPKANADLKERLTQNGLDADVYLHPVHLLVRVGSGDKASARKVVELPGPAADSITIQRKKTVTLTLDGRSQERLQKAKRSPRFPRALRGLLKECKS